MIFGMAFGMYDFYTSLGKPLMLPCDENFLFVSKCLFKANQSEFKL